MSRLLSALLLSLISPLALTEVAPEPAATAIIEELGLRESQTAMSDNPRWKPGKVVVA